MKFCPKCGRNVNRLYDGLCSQCSSEKIEIFTYNPKDITICVSCENVFDGRKQLKEGSQEERISQIVGSRVELNDKLSSPILNVDFNMEPHPVKQGAKKVLHAHMHLKAKAEGNVDIDEEYSLPFNLRYITCEHCSKKNTNYFEGILQIRHDEPDKVEKALSLLDKIMKEERKRSVFETNRVESKKGVDVFITSQKHIKDIGKKIFESLGGEMKINEQLFSRDHMRSKNLYRVNVLLRLPDFSLGDVIDVQDKMLLVKRIKGHLSVGIDIIANKKATINCKDSEVTLVAKKEDIKKSPITMVYPHVEALEPKDYQSVVVQNPKMLKSPKMEKEIRVFSYKGALYTI